MALYGMKAHLHRIQQNKYDSEAWDNLLKDIQARKIDDVREHYETLVNTFPTTGRYWKSYIEHEIRQLNYDRVEKLFQRCLMKVLNMELWKTYLNYVRVTKESLPNYKEKMAQAYDFTLDKMALDMISAPIWNEYIEFLRSVQGIGSYGENQKIFAIRKVYHRAIFNPMHHIDQIWKDYVSFENGVNPMLAEKLIFERTREHMNVRRASKELEAVTRGINKNEPCVPPTGSPSETEQMELWQKYISWEKSNPMNVEDLLFVIKRVMFAYEQCILCFAHHPSVWHEAASYLYESAQALSAKGDVTSAKNFLEQSSAMYEKATSGILQKSLLLNLAYADFEEKLNNFEKATRIYERYVEMEDIDNPTLCYIQYMRFVRRIHGSAKARAIFKKGREDVRTTYQLYIGAAEIEFFCSKDVRIATNIFELGLKKYKEHEESYLLAFFDFVVQQNDDNNTRVLFERIISTCSESTKKQPLRRLWDRFLKFESTVGAMSSIQNVERRKSKALLSVDDSTRDSSAFHSMTREATQLVDRYSFFNLYPCTENELKALNYRRVGTASICSSFSSGGVSSSDVTLGMTSTSENTSSSVSFTASSSTSESNNNNTSSAKISAVDNCSIESSYKVFRPDTSHMVGFRPKFAWQNAHSSSFSASEHRHPGGGFAPPYTAQQLMLFLPPPDCFQGPFVITDRLMEVFDKVKLPEQVAIMPRIVTDNDRKLIQSGLKKSDEVIDLYDPESKRRKVHESSSKNQAGSNGEILVRAEGEGGGDRDDFGSHAHPTPPINDLYRQRQQNKMNMIK